MQLFDHTLNEAAAPVNARGGWPSVFQHRREPMKSNARCWTPPVVAQLIAMIWPSACAMGGSDERGQACPPAVDYNRSDQSRLTDEISALADTSMIVRVLKDYAVLRDQARTCDAGRPAIYRSASRASVG
ncbi:MAG: hypothetical protein WAT09_10805 [Paracoccaceae bacterium]